MAGDHRSSPFLLRLPNEIQAKIVRQLDPTSVLALSETCTDLRNLINPGPQERLEHLLTLECQHSLGGHVVVYGRPQAFPLRASNLSEIRSWAGFRWACSSCVRLLPHSHFKNSAVFSAAQRKPDPASFPQTPVTGWRGGSDANRLISDGILPPRPTTLLTIADYSNAVVLVHPDGDLYAMFVGADRQHWGYERHLRKCISCLYKETLPSPRTYGAWIAGEVLEEIVGFNGHLPDPVFFETNNITIPAIRTLCVVSVSMLARYFPGFLDSLAEPGEERHSARLARLLTHTAAWGDQHEQFMINCQSCGQWKEQRSFFVREQVEWTSGWNMDDPSCYDRHIRLLEEHKDKGLCCGVCFLADYGREAFIARILPWFVSLVDAESGHEKSKFDNGWGTIVENWHLNRLLSESSESYTEPMRELLEIYQPDTEPPNISQEQVVQLRELRQQLFPLVEAFPIGDRTFGDGRVGMEAWLVRYEDVEYQMLWLEMVKEKVQNNPDLLADWILERDSHPFNVLESAEK